jgi:hypothetical protein
MGLYLAYLIATDIFDTGIFVPYVQNYDLHADSTCVGYDYTVDYAKEHFACPHQIIIYGFMRSKDEITLNWRKS